ncbi:MADF domain-containing protein [Aphis craccivora]|uniref:MADF domain-containing protein n=1 Tax=Aphis craccivora TaxID=307492 RepID=A0A6G0YJF3_APHCR|nr:MADF domain-containing protein [Aphis craccivora]
MSYRKQSNLSSRSKRRRVEDELRNINIPFNISEDVMVVNYDIPSLIATNKSRSQSKSIVEIDLPTNPNENNTFINLNQNRIQNTTELTEDPIYDSADDEIKYLSSETDEDDDIHLLKNDNDISSIISLITQWAITYNIPQNALSKLLLIFRQHSCFETIPKDARTIMLSNNAKPNLRVVEPGKYHHFGIANAYIYPNNESVFPIGIYCGKEKPKDSNDFIKDFIDESKVLIEQGLYIDSKKYNFSIRTMCCDVPAKSYILKIKGHSGFYSCSKCEIEGEYLANRICFPYTPSIRCPPTRTHQNYLVQSQEEHHVGNTSLLATLPMFDVITTFSLDYMHLVCLGTVRKLIMLWIKEPIGIRNPSWKIEEMSKALEQLKTHVPCEFARKPRTLLEVVLESD